MIKHNFSTHISIFLGHPKMAPKTLTQPTLVYHEIYFCSFQLASHVNDLKYINGGKDI